MENRGYDSFGISYYDKNEKLYKVYKKSNYWNIGQEQDLFEYFKEKTKHIESNICIGHSRWATHGKISDINANNISNRAGLYLISLSTSWIFKPSKPFFIYS